MKNWLGMYGILIMAGLFSGLTGTVQTVEAAPAEVSQPSTDPEKRAEQILGHMSLEEKVGQMLLLGIHGPQIDAETDQLLQQVKPGGIILYDANMQDPRQVTALNHDLQQHYGKQQPLFLGLDEEGGLVARMKEHLSAPCSEEALGQTGRPVEARKSAIRISQELKTLGFNMNFAPVADIGSGRERSFSKSATVVADFVEAAAQGYEQENMIYVLKHFPGIGKGKADTHQDRVVVAASREELQNEDIQPFRRIIGKYPVTDYFVMVSHVTYPALDAGNPATLSRAIQTDLLRGQLGYTGVIITDAMEMGALSRYYSFDEIGIKAIQAGADILLVSHGYEHEQAIYASVLAAVKAGVIPESRIDASVRRILKVKLGHLIDKTKR